ncbi:MAG: hypothetical protein ACO1QS_04585 [Verrucomicrobiota bacterium]
MNQIRTVVLSLFVVLVGGCQPSSAPAPSAATPPSAPVVAVPVKPLAASVQPLLRWHSVGWQAVTNETEGTRLKELLALPQTVLVKSNTLVALSRNLPAILFPEAPTNKDQATKLRPLLDDVLTYETKVVWASESPLRWRLAVKIPVERTGIWTANLYDLLVRGEQLDKIPRTNITDASVTVTYSAAETYRYGLKDSWVTVERAESGYDWDAVTRSEATTGTNTWFALEMQTAISKQLGGLLPAANQPYARLTMEGKGANQTSRLSLKFPQALAVSLPPWQVPTNTIKDPVISFTALRGVGGWWSQQDWLKPLQLTNAPQQAYVWSQPQAYYSTFAAFPARDASLLMTNSFSRTNEFTAAMGKLFFGRMVALKNELVWTGAPILAPTLKAAPEPQDDHLLLSLFPLARSAENLPSALLEQFVGRTNLLYYDWEITEMRLNQWMRLAPLLSMVANRMPLNNSKVPYEWLAAIAPKLGNTVTEAELAAPDEIQVLRKSPAGFTGVELYLLARWLDQKNLPQWDPQRSATMSLPGIPAAPPVPKKN